MVVAEIIYSIMLIGLAWYNARLFDRNNPDDKEKSDRVHRIQGAAFLLAGALAAVVYGWPAFFLVLSLTRLLFTSVFYKLRGDSIFYVTPTPRAFIDRFEQSFFGQNGRIPFFIYVAILILSQILVAA